MTQAGTQSATRGAATSMSAADSWWLLLDRLCDDVVGPQAPTVDAEAAYPRAAVTAMARDGLLGLVSATEVGGMGLGLAEAGTVIRRLAAHCASTAMVMCMHYAAASVIEAHGPIEVRRAIAEGLHLSSLAFSEPGSRSHFWVPMGTARVDHGQVVLDATKSWVTSAGEADSYVWSSLPLAAPAPDAGARSFTLWLVPAEAPGLEVAGGFDGLGLRGNASKPVTATGVRIPPSAGLGGDGAGMDIAMGSLLPLFLVMVSSCSLGIMDAACAKAVAHARATRLEHLDATLADQPVVRHRLAGMQNRADSAAALVDDAVASWTSGRDDAFLRILQVKAVTGEAALVVCDAAMRVGGGAAFRRDVGIERHFRDARASAVMAPTADMLDDLVGRLLCGLPVFP